MALLTVLPFTLVTTVVVAIVFTAQRRRLSQRFRGHKLPPGPQGWPIIGCLFELPSGDRPWTVYREWAHKYGDLTLFKVFNTPMLLVSSGEIILELTEKRSAIYSDKPQQAIDELTGWQFDMSAMPHGPQWRITRRMFHQHFNQTVTPKYYDKQTKEIYEFLARCLDQPSSKPLDPQCIRLTLAAIIMDIVYGIQVQNMDDDYIKLAEQTTEVFNQSRLMGKFWIDFLPILKHVPSWVPGAAAVQYAKTWRPVVDATVNRSFDAVKQRVCSDEARLACVASELIDEISQGGNPERNCEEEQHAKNATAIAYVAGADTTVSLIQTFFCCMAMHPEVQKKAQEELDLVVGQDRLPTYGDWNYLPYIHAILMECSRWLPVVPISLPRRAIADDYYEGYFIPEGTVVIANIWHILRDPHVYPDPERFNPDRFMKDGALDHNVPDPNRLAFGFGRRICPGRHLAKETAFLTMAAVLHVFNVLPAVNENGQELDPTPQMTTGVQSYPDPLNYTLKPRSEAAERLIRAVVL